MTPPPRQHRVTAHSLAKAHHGWGTEDEVEYIHCLGRGMFGAPSRSRQTLLRQYRSAMAWRQEWGRIDADAVRQVVEAALQGEKNLCLKV